MKVALLYAADAAHLQRLRALAPQAQFVLGFASLAAAVEAVRDADVVMGNWFFTEALSQVDQSSLRWVQTPSVGVDRHLPALRNAETMLTNASGLYDDEVADHMLALTLALLRDLPAARDRQREGLWQRGGLSRLADCTVLILGFGGIGQAYARRVSACGAKVLSVRLHDAQTDWRGQLGNVDVLTLALPLTLATRHIVDATVLAALPKGAFVVNAARGGLLDEQALLEALRSGHLGGAALDVFESEPLPPEHPLWRAPRLLITPHEARSKETKPALWEDLFEHNFASFVHGRPLKNVVDRRRGY